MQTRHTLSPVFLMAIGAKKLLISYFFNLISTLMWLVLAKCVSLSANIQKSLSILETDE